MPEPPSRGPVAASPETNFLSTMQYYGFRYLDVSLGLWLSRDPIGERGSSSLYAFVRNSAVGKSDILGRIELPPPDPPPLPEPSPPANDPPTAEPPIPGPPNQDRIQPPRLHRYIVSCIADFLCVCCPEKYSCGGVRAWGTGGHDTHADLAESRAKAQAMVAAEHKCMHTTTCPQPGKLCRVDSVRALPRGWRNTLPRGYYISEDYVCRFRDRHAPL